MSPKKRKRILPRDKGTGKFVSYKEPVEVPKKVTKGSFLAILPFIIFVFSILFMLNNAGRLDFIYSSISQILEKPLSEKAPITTETNTGELSKISALKQADTIETKLGLSSAAITKSSTGNQLSESDGNQYRIGRILVQNGNVKIISKGDPSPSDTLYPGRIIKNGDQITVGVYPSYISFVLDNENSIMVIYDNSNVQVVINEANNLFKIKYGKMHVNIRPSSKFTDFVSEHSQAKVEKQDFALINLWIDEGRDQFVTIDGRANVKNELSGLSLIIEQKQKLFSTNIGQLIWSLANESDFVIGPKTDMEILPLEKAPTKKVNPIQKIEKKVEKILDTKPKITLAVETPAKPKLPPKPPEPTKPKLPPKPPEPAKPKLPPKPPEPAKNYDKIRDYDFNIASETIRRESIVTYLETPLMGDIPVYYLPDSNSNLVSSISENEKFIVYPIYRFGFVVVGRLGTGQLGYAEAELIDFSSQDRLGKIIDLSKTRFIIEN